MVTSFSHTMSFIVSIFTIFLTFQTVKTQNVTRGSSLTPTGATTSWLSPSGLYAFGFYPQTRGYAVGVYIAGIPERTVVWTASRDHLPISNNATLRFTIDGGLTLDGTQGQEINIYDISGASFASMQDNGNFVLYEGTTVLWQSFDHPTDTLLTGQRLANGQTLISSVSEADQSTGVFKLRMQSDGHLVQYAMTGTPDYIGSFYWGSGTQGNGPNVTLNLDSGGFLYLLKNSTFLIRNLTQGGYPRDRAIYRMKVDVDGIFRLYYHDLRDRGKNGSVIWASSDNKCAGKGLCGVNGYCSIINDAARCQCLPGFEFVNQEFWSLGCKRNYTIENCKITDAGKAFQMVPLNHARWEEATYAIPEASTQEECSLACLNDCNCEVALFTERECRLQRLPLRFIEVAESESNVGLVKVYTSSVNNGSDTCNPSTRVKKVRQLKILVIGVSLISFAVLILLLAGVLIFCRNHVFAYKKVSVNHNVQLFDDIGPRTFSYGELERITDGFKEEVGRGSFGIVYKGIIESSKKAVAVKKLKKEFAQQGEREFQTETKVIGKTYHRNLARLLGYCCEGSERLLVFEYMTNGSLADILFEPKASKPKPCWMERIQMAVDIARGILYLHEECEMAIIHCDIKPQNILMDEYGCAKISDFGLAKLLQHDQTRTSTLIRGTRGYVAPEWYKKQPITVKVDVYSFGIVLFSILCGRKNVDNSLPVEEAILEEWVYDCYASGEVYKLVDDEDVDKKTLDRMIKIGLWCIQKDPSLRPSMKQVVLMLEGTVKIPVPPNPYSFLSDVN
uniref:G-type lectin S-receptor-like serine/threonine-protein kinase LECRK1 n=1 Tax=Erigeron canadensis TaxID=72917 RepID=UPI001CB9046B|nr:G-type lectin S-receptor-like serine/threonine-protein kinase LECRK1 [Erigeron canadensis]